MRTVSIIILIAIFGCNQITPQKKVDWKAEWRLNETRFKKLINQIKSDKTDLYTTGQNEYPEGFLYPFDDTFFLVQEDSLFVAIFYLEKNNHDSISTFAYTNDPAKVIEFNGLLENSDSNKKIDQNWYYIRRY